MKGLTPMANSIYKTRTNYVHVTDEETFKEICRLGCTAELEPLTVITARDDNGEDIYGFCAEGDIEGYILNDNGAIVDFNAEDFNNERDWNRSFDRFVEDLKSVVAPDDALIITTIGSEKMRYLSANSFVITHDEIKEINLSEMAKQTAREMLGDESWNTRMEY